MVGDECSSFCCEQDEYHQLSITTLKLIRKAKSSGISDRSLTYGEVKLKKK